MNQELYIEFGIEIKNVIFKKIGELISLLDKKHKNNFQITNMFISKIITKLIKKSILIYFPIYVKFYNKLTYDKIIKFINIIRKKYKD